MVYKILFCKPFSPLNPRFSDKKNKKNVLMNPRAKKKVSVMSQGIGSPKAEKAAAKVSVLVSTNAPRPIRAIVPLPESCAR
jgi:hypothetical protein